MVNARAVRAETRSTGVTEPTFQPGRAGSERMDARTFSGGFGSSAAMGCAG